MPGLWFLYEGGGGNQSGVRPGQRLHPTKLFARGLSKLTLADYIPRMHWQRRFFFLFFSTLNSFCFVSLFIRRCRRLASSFIAYMLVTWLSFMTSQCLLPPAKWPITQSEFWDHSHCCYHDSQGQENLVTHCFFVGLHSCLKFKLSYWSLIFDLLQRTHWLHTGNWLLTQMEMDTFLKEL